MIGGAPVWSCRGKQPGAAAVKFTATAVVTCHGSASTNLLFSC